MAGTINQKLKDLVEQSITGLRESPEFRIVGSNPDAQQELINRRLYDLYEDTKRNSSKAMLRMLKEVLNGYPGFPEYFKKRQSEDN